MYCSKCGTENSSNENFCKNCGYRLNDNLVTNNDKDLENIVNPNTTIWAVLSIVFPIAGFLIYWFKGITLLLAIIISGVGFTFASKGKSSNPKIARTGEILNGLFLGLIIILYILSLVLDLI